MSDDAQRWKDKYLQQLEQQEQLEGRWNTRLDLLRRSLVRSSFAVDGPPPPKKTPKATEAVFTTAWCGSRSIARAAHSIERAG